MKKWISIIVVSIFVMVLFINSSKDVSETAKVVRQKLDIDIVNPSGPKSDLVDTKEIRDNKISKHKISKNPSSLYKKEIKTENDILKREGNEKERYEKEILRQQVKEQQQVEMERRREYSAARHTWRRALNEARKEAKKTGNYEKYNFLKNNEPNKSMK